jgi:hypothetical protein
MEKTNIIISLFFIIFGWKAKVLRKLNPRQKHTKRLKQKARLIVMIGLLILISVPM